MSRKGLVNFFAATVLVAATASQAAEQRASATRAQTEERLEQQLPQSLKVQRSREGSLSTQDLEVAQSLTEEASYSPQALEEARTRVQRVLEKDGRNQQANMLAGRIALLEKNPQLAVSHYRAAAAVRPVNAAALLGLGQSLEAAGDAQGAATAFAEYRAAMGLTPIPTTQAAASAPAQPVRQPAEKK
jgi:lipopolysaccharide biosynthesis regulator YciM